MRALSLVVVAAAIALAARSAAAWPTGDKFDGDALEEGGGGGIAFDGAARWSGHDCAACHTDAPGRVRLRLEASPAELFTTGYEPARQYRLRVRLIGEHAALDYLAAGDNCFPTVEQRCDDNGFALEIDDAAGRPSGTLAPTAADGSCGPAAPDASAYVLADGSAVTHSGYHHGMDAWTFCWTAPAAGTGALGIFVSAVDGNGGEGTNANPSDMQGDDVVTGVVPLLEAGGEAPRTQSGACAIATGRAGRAAALPLLLLLFIGAGVVAVAARPRRRLALALILLLGGCVTVRPYEKEKLAERKMQFGADADERELDLHMQEAREGSAGGYGSAGGGCGCN